MREEVVFEKEKGVKIFKVGRNVRIGGDILS